MSGQWLVASGQWNNRGFFAVMRRCVPTIAVLAVLGMLSLAACTPAGREKWRNQTDRRSSKQLLQAALHDPRADERRRAVNLLADGSAGKAAETVAAFDEIARRDADAMVRAAAARALGRCAGAQCVPTLVKLLDSADRAMDDTRPAPAAVRWEAALLLQRFSAGQEVESGQREAVLTSLLGRLERDADRNVRLTVVATLQHYPDKRTLPPVIHAMRTRDFALQLRAEDTLHELTGQSHDLDPDAWEQWLARASNPFAAASSRPAVRESWWSRMTGGSSKSAR